MPDFPTTDGSTNGMLGLFVPTLITPLELLGDSDEEEKK